VKERTKNSFLFLTVIGCEYLLSSSFLVDIVACLGLQSLENGVTVGY
jgi:hypothetical protein